MIHLGHDCSVREVVEAAVQDVQGVASAYQAATSSTSSSWSTARRARRRARSISAAGRRHRPRAGSNGWPPRVSDLPPRTASASAWVRSRRMVAACDVDPRTRAFVVEPRTRWWPGDRALARVMTGPRLQVARPLDPAVGGPRPARARPGHHRDRWVRQVLAHRRFCPAAAGRPAGQDARHGSSPWTQPPSWRWRLLVRRPIRMNAPAAGRTASARFATARRPRSRRTGRRSSPRRSGFRIW